MKKKLFARIFISFIIVSLCLGVLIALFSIESVRRHYLASEETSLKNYLGILNSMSEPLIIRNDRAGLEVLVTKLGDGTDIRYTVVAPDGVVMADSEKNPAEMDNHFNRPEIQGALHGGTPSSSRFSNTIKENMLYLATVYRDKSGDIRAILRASKPLADISVLSDSLARDIIKALVLITAFSILLAYFYSRRFYEPIKELAEASKKVASRDFNVKVSVRERDEIWELAENFNFMTAQIKELFEAISEKQKQLDAVIDSVAEGLIVLDEKGRIVLINRSFKKIADSEVKEGNFYWECFMPTRFNEAVEQGLKERKYFVEQMDIKDRVYLCSATFLEEKGQSAFVLYDITEFKDLERIKKDFVANVSHELRTPLTAIKGFAETLEQDTKDPDSRRYLDIIKKNTERLINIVADLLTLSQLEEMEKLREPEKVDLQAVLMNCAKVFEQPVRHKGLAFSMDIQKGLPPVMGDPFRLEQVFINLIDNAVKYTEKGSVTVIAAAENSSVKVTVADTGSGIPAEHLPRIFERFYVVDKSRSRKLGGTGLGLSIVKHIVQLHGGRITAESEAGSWTRLTVTLPAKKA